MMHLICFFFPLLLALSSVSAVKAKSLWDVNSFDVVPCGYGGGGRFTAVAIDPNDPQTILVGSDVAGVFKTENGGDSFSLKGRGLEGFVVADITFHPTSARHVYLLTNKGLHISDDKGETWRNAAPAIRYGSRYCGSTQMVASRKSLWVGTDNQGVFQVSLDTSRFSSSPVPGLEKVKVNGLTIFKGHLYAGTSRGVYRHKNGRWEPYNRGISTLKKEIVDIAAHHRKRFYVTEKTAGLHVWNETAEQWEKSAPVGPKIPKAFMATVFQPRNPDKLLLSTHPKTWPHVLFMTDTGGKSWNRLTRFHPSPTAAENWSNARTLNAVEEIAFSPSDPQQLCLADWWNVWKSTNGGQDWSQLHKGLQNTVVCDIKVHPENTDKIFLCLADNGLMVSEDAGKTWKRKMSGAVDGHAFEIEISRRNPSKMYLLVNAWDTKKKVFVYKSLSGGETWEDVGFSVPYQSLPKLGYVNGQATNLEIDPVSDDTVYVGTNGYGVYKTVNGGRQWNAVNHGLATPYIFGADGLLIHPRKPRTLFASTLAGGVYKSTNGARTWKALYKKQPFTYGMALDPANSSRILVCCPRKKLIISSDEGNTWKEVHLPGKAPRHISCSSVAIHPQHPHLVYVGTLAHNYSPADGLFVSQDGGKTFSKVPLDLPGVNILDVAVQKRSDPSVLIGYSGLGIFRGTFKRKLY